MKNVRLHRYAVQAIGILAHLMGTLLATGMVLWLPVRLLMRDAGHEVIRRSALALFSTEGVVVPSA
jgi:hypothetical protein